MWLSPAGWLCLQNRSHKTHRFNSVLHQIMLLCHFGKSKALVKKVLIITTSSCSFHPSTLACQLRFAGITVGKKGATFFFPAVYFSSLRQSCLPESKHLSLWLMDCRSLTLPCVFKGKRVWSTGKSTGWLGEKRYWKILTWLLKVPSHICRIQADSFPPVSISPDQSNLRTSSVYSSQPWATCMWRCVSVAQAHRRSFGIYE